ncbi:MAG: type IV secretory system conjugative DNA transfer family protein [Minisyncoccota bacterium]
MRPYDENRVTYFAETDARNRHLRFGIKAKDRTKHVYVIGKTGMGKSTLLENMAVQDIQNGEGIAFVDPHGKTADLFLDYIPEHRLKDVVYFAPFDTDNPISFNIMEDVGYDKRHLVVSGLMSAFKKIWVDAWSARMEYILGNVLLALLEYPGATLLGVNRMLTDKSYRKKVVDNVKDPSVRSFWVDEFAKYTDRYTQDATPAIQNKVGQFTSNPLIRNIVGQPKSTFDIREMMDDQKILIVNLSKGLVGEGNANLLGSMLITKIYLAAMSRADVPEATMRLLPNFYLYVDEFQSFANESFADILSEARKYKLNLTMAHQYIEQMSDEVRAAVFGNVGTMAMFRVGAYDAEVLEKELAPVFTAEDMVNLGFAQIYLKLMIDGVSSSPFSAKTLPPIKPPEKTSRNEVVASSRKNFARSRPEVEKAINDWYGSGDDQQSGETTTRPLSDRTAGQRVDRSGESPRAARDDRPRPASRPQAHPSGVSSPVPSPRRTEDRRENFERRSSEHSHHQDSQSFKNSTHPREQGLSLGALRDRENISHGHRDAPPLPTSDHKAALKDALAMVIKKDQEKKEEKNPQGETEQSSQKNVSSQKPTPPEIPEDVLRSVLDISHES